MIHRHGFSNDDLDKFAELLFSIISSSDDTALKILYACGIFAIYDYLEKNGRNFSFNSYYIFKELKQIL